MVGMEVPITGSDSVKWHDVTVPSAPPPPSADATPPPLAASPLAKDVASCSIIGDPPHYLIWKIHKNHPNALELQEFSGDKDFPKTGLRLLFPNALFPFAHICKDETSRVSGNSYLLYTLTTTGVGYLLKLKDLNHYASCAVFPLNQLVEFNVQSYHHYGEITDAAAIDGCLAIGRSGGSVSCFQLGIFEPSAPGFVYELRDDAGFGRLWSLMSRRSVGAVQDMVMTELHGRNLLFVLHSDGALRVWDLISRCRIFCSNLSIPTLTEAIFLNLWVGEANNDRHAIPLAILCRSSLEVGSEIIYVYNLGYGFGERTTFVLDASAQNIPMDEEGLIDVKLTSNKIWILKEDGLTMLNLSNTPDIMGRAECYSLQEAFVADQLFQSSEHSFDDLLWLAQSIASPLKGQVAPLVSAIFLRKLLCSGVHHSTVLRATFQDHNKHLTDLEFCSLTVDGLKKEIISLVGHEGVSASPVSLLYCWKNFTARFFHIWCEINAPVGFLFDSRRGTIGVIRKNSVSLFRNLEDIELLIYGSFDEVGDIVSSGLDFSGDNLDCEILLEVLRCISNISQQLGKAASSVFYESVISAPCVSSEEILPRLLKILQCGHSPSVTTLNISELGSDVAWMKEVRDHKNLRKFSTEMFLSLHALSSKAETWEKVLDVIERYLNLLVPRKVIHRLGSEVGFSSSTSAAVLATSQVAKVMFESALDILLFLSYMVNIGGQIHLWHKEISKIQLELIPMIQEVMSEWHIIYYLGTTASESPVNDDFSSQLSCLQIDNKLHKRSWDEKLGKCDFTLACLLLLNIQTSYEDHDSLSLKYLPNPAHIIKAVRDITSWIIWGSSGEETSGFFSHSTELALILLRHGQYNAVEYLLIVVDTHLRKERTSESIQSDDGQWATLLHLLGCCLLAQAQGRLQGVQKQQKVSEAVRCFFRVSSIKGAPQALQGFSNEVGLPQVGFTTSLSVAAWKLQYYQWAMQVFEQYNYSEGACQFALASLEQVDEALGTEDNIQESVIIVRGRLWANVFKFTLDLNNYFDAYCAIISNPDEESKYICLRRFIIVLYERGDLKILCNGTLPFIGLADKVEQELASKAARAEVSAKPNPLKLLYAFEVHRHNWRKAAAYIYSYSSRLKIAASYKDHQGRSLILQDRLNALSASINALHLVHPAYAWIDNILEDKLLLKEDYPSKKARTEHEQAIDKSVPAKQSQSFVDIEKLENEFVLTSTEYVLSLSNVYWTCSGNEKPSPDVVDLLVQADLYDMAFTVILRFWRGSELKRELARVFKSMSFKCCPDTASHPYYGNAHRQRGLLLTSSRNEVVVHGSLDVGPPEQQFKGNTQWETLERYLEKYKGFHPSLPIIVAETLLSTDPHIELPLWLVQMFKGVRRDGNQGMTGDEANPASLLRLYVDYGRLPEATNLLLEFIESYASTRPNELVRRKRPSAVWFPYTTIERLWVQLEEHISKNYKVDQCQKMKTLLQGALQGHLSKLREDSADVQASALVHKSLSCTE